MCLILKVLVIILAVGFVSAHYLAPYLSRGWNLSGQYLNITTEVPDPDDNFVEKSNEEEIEDIAALKQHETPERKKLTLDMKHASPDENITLIFYVGSKKINEIPDNPAATDTNYEITAAVEKCLPKTKKIEAITEEPAELSDILLVDKNNTQRLKQGEENAWSIKIRHPKNVRIEVIGHESKENITKEKRAAAKKITRQDPSEDLLLMSIVKGIVAPKNVPEVTAVPTVMVDDPFPLTLQELVDNSRAVLSVVPTAVVEDDSTINSPKKKFFFKNVHYKGSIAPLVQKKMVKNSKTVVEEINDVSDEYGSLEDDVRFFKIIEAIKAAERMVLAKQEQNKNFRKKCLLKRPSSSTVTTPQRVEGELIGKLTLEDVSGLEDSCENGDWYLLSSVKPILKYKLKNDHPRVFKVRNAVWSSHVRDYTLK